MTVAAGRRGVRLWEAVAIVGLVVGTIEVARNGTWLLFVAAYPAARALRLGTPSGGCSGLRRWSSPVRRSCSSRAARPTRGRTCWPSGPLASGARCSPARYSASRSQLAGGSVWVDNPIDAFRRSDQRLYLHWLDGKPDGAAAVAHAGYVLVVRDSAAGRLAAHDPRLAPLRRPRRPRCTGFGPAPDRSVKDERGAKAPLSSPRQVASTRRF